MKPLRRRALALLVVGALTLGTAACSDGDGGGTDEGSGADGAGRADTSAVLEGIATDVIVPSYRDLVTDLDALGTAYDALCATPSPDTLTTAQESWRTAATGWQETRGSAVGSAMDRRLMAAVSFRARPDPARDLIAGDEAIDTASLTSRGSTFHGLSLMQELLFGDDSGDLTSAAGARTCTFLVNVLPVSTDAVTAVLADWEDADPPYVDTFAAGAEGDPLLSVDALTNQAIAALTAIDDNGIRDLAMAETLDDALSTRRDGPGAYVMAEHRALLDSIAWVLDGGLGDLVEERSPDTATRLRDLTAAAVEAVAPLPDSVDEAYTDDLDGLTAASEAIAALKVLLTTEVASQLGITVRFSDADGDS